MLSDSTICQVRFSEVDAIGIVWHGHFLKYLEDGRESFGKKYGLAYNDVFGKGYLTPIVNLNIDYKLRVKYGDEIIVETIFESCDAAKIIFRYTLYRRSDNEVVLTATSTQVFVNHSGELELTAPGFFLEWKNKHGV
jgi:acyl-CoA thioester hydrolase